MVFKLKKSVNGFGSGRDLWLWDQASNGAPSAVQNLLEDSLSLPLLLPLSSLIHGLSINKLNLKKIGAPGWLSWLSIYPRVLGSSPKSGALLSRKPASSSPSAAPPACALSLLVK